MSIITVSGEMGSQRDELAQELCRLAGLELVDRRTLMDAVAGLVDMSRDEHQLLAEQGPALLDLGNRRRRVFAALLESVVLQYAQAGKVALVGRGANLLLKLVPGVLRVRTVAALDLRAQRLARRENLELDQARRLATVVDQQRRAYIAHLFAADWSSPLHYDLVLNMGRLTVEQAAACVLDLAAHPDFEITSEGRRLIDGLVLAARVRRELVSAVDVHALEVSADGDRVRLEGYVVQAADQKRARELAEAVQGVARVECRLEVSAAMSKFLP